MRWCWRACLVGVAGLAYARLESEWCVLRRYHLPVLPPGAGELRILHLSDLHLSSNASSRRRARWVQGLADLQPDLVITTGDNLALPDGLPVALDALDPLLDVPGGFVFGSNDYYAARFGNPASYLVTQFSPAARARREAALAAQTTAPPDLPCEELRAALVARGWHDLNNARATVEAAGMEMDLVGLDDPHIARAVLPTSAGSVGGAPLRIGVVHAPYRAAVNALVGDGATLVLAGHTHGGQLALPGWGAIVSNCDLPPRMAKGLHRWSGEGPGEAWLEVSAGLGTNPHTPVRFACRPEASLLTLTERDTPAVAGPG